MLKLWKIKMNYIFWRYADFARNASLENISMYSVVFSPQWNYTD
jgi:hypothetical protein